jgi:hypothetical protein
LEQAKGRIKKITGTIVETKTVERGWKIQEIVGKGQGWSWGSEG